MAKGLPYLKFNPDIWLLGNISLEDMAVQGLYINICAFYWHKDGNLHIDEVKKKYRNESELIPELTDRFLNVDELGKIHIDWLDEQFEERNHLSLQNTINGKKGGRPQTSKTLRKKPTAFKNESESKAKITNIEENRIEENRIEKNRKEIEARKLKFASTLEPFLKKYGRPMLNDFYKYWTEPNKSLTRFRQESEKTWDVELRLEKWAANDKTFNNGKPPADGQQNKIYNGSFFKNAS